jgi:RNA polymerase sigma-70 factor (ECF subfamily)
MEENSNLTKNLSDEELIKQLQSPDCLEKELLFETLVDRYKDKLFQFIYNYIKFYGTQDDAEELLLQTFSNFWFSIEKFKFKSAVYTYLYRIALNLSSNFAKSKFKTLKHTISLDEIDLEKELPETQPVEPEFSQTFSTQNLINLAIEKLPLNQKTAIVLSYYENKSYAEISQIMGKSISSVESLLFRAKQNLKKYILKYTKNF